MDPEEILTAAGVATVFCILFDHGMHALQEWQRARAGVINVSGFGPFGRTVISLGMSSVTCVLIAYIYRIVGHQEEDAFLIGASIWLMVSVPVLFTSRFVDDIQKRLLATRILGWLFKAAIAAASAAYFVTIGS